MTKDYKRGNSPIASTDVQVIMCIYMQSMNDINMVFYLTVSGIESILHMKARGVSLLLYNGKYVCPFLLAHNFD